MGNRAMNVTWFGVYMARFHRHPAIADRSPLARIAQDFQGAAGGSHLGFFASSRGLSSSDRCNGKFSVCDGEKAPVALLPSPRGELSFGGEVFRGAIEDLLVIFDAEVIGPSLVRGRQGAIDWHAADSADRMVSRLVDGTGELGVGIRIQPALALILQKRGSLACHIPAEVALHHPEGEIHSRSEAAGARQVARFHKAGSTLNMNVRILHREVDVSAVMRGRRLAGEQAGTRKHKGACANGHRNIRVLCRIANPGFGGFAGRALCGDNNDLGCGRIGDGIVRRDLQSTARSDGSGSLRHRIETEGIILPVGNVDSFENFPWAAEINNDGTF